MRDQILLGDALEQLRTLADNSVHCAVTSPPYFGLRDYGVEGQIGLEKTPDEFIAKMVALFRELRRVLRDDGTLWLNMGDSYAGSGRGLNADGTPGKSGEKQKTNVGSVTTTATSKHLHSNAIGNGAIGNDWVSAPPGFKQKDLMGMPWRLALALQADGWWLRSDIIWAKPNPMPSSVTDRPTTAHEYIFLLSKSARYFYDEFAVREASVTNENRPYGAERQRTMDYNVKYGPKGSINNRNGKNAFRGQGAERDSDSGPANRDDRDMSTVGIGATRNMRSVWTMATEPFPDAHFATFPTALPAKCIAAGTSERGVCPQCGAPWVRIVEKSFTPQTDVSEESGVRGALDQKPMDESNHWEGFPRGITDKSECGWRAGCDHGAEPVPATVLDPFSGAGTTGVVAKRMGRSYIGIELNPAYIAIAEKRLANIHPLFAEAGNE